ncbi:MAG: ATP-binding protein [Bacteroidetes bacterium]|nr:ATP-binding protein [Bacteroidota bacterium]
MTNKNFNIKNYALWYAIYGVLFGLSFPVIAIVIDIYRLELPTALSSIVKVHALTPLHYIIDTAPIFLGLLAAIAGYHRVKVEQFNTSLEKLIDERTFELQTLNEELNSSQEELRQNLDYTTRINHKLSTNEKIISDQNAQQKELLIETEESKKELQNFFNLSIHFMCLANTNGYFTKINSTFTRVLGYSEEELLSKPFFEFIHPDDLANTLKEVEKLAQGVHTINFTNRYSCKDGSYVLLMWSASPDTKTGILYATAHDITEFRQLENIKIKNIELSKQKELADQSVKLRDSFLANMSHEIRTPMNAIIGLSNLLGKSGELNNKQKEYVKTIHLNSNNLLNIINEILDFSKIEAGKLELINMPFNLHEVLKSSCQSLSPIAEEKKLKLNLQFDDRIQSNINGDAIRLNQILLNLISNAIKYSEKGEITLCTELLGEMAGLITIKFSVKDTGIGIPLEKQASIFNPFVQGTDFYTRSQSGTGLGLAIAKKLVELFGSFIQLKSEVGVGSEFSFIISFENTSENSINQTTPTLQNKHKNKHLKLLLVEDNEFNRLVAIDTISLWDTPIDIDIAENGKIAVDMVKKQHYDLILMDIQMPEMDGHTATKIIRNELKLNTPILAMTAHASVKEKETCLANGMNDFISKPFDEQILYKKILDLTQSHTSDAQKENIEVNQNIAPAIAYEVVDAPFVIQFTKGKKERLEKMVNLFLKETPKELETLSALLKEKNFAALKTLAHSLKPKMMYMGLQQLSDLARQIELSAAAESNIDEIPKMINSMEIICKKACAELEYLIKK